MRALPGMALGAALLAGCGHKPPMVTQQAFADAARACHAKGASFTPPGVKDEAPELHVTDSVVTVDGKRIDASRCLAVRLKGFRYGRIVLDAPPIGPSTK